MYFKELDANTKKYFFQLKENFSGAFIFVAIDSQFLVQELTETANSIGIYLVVCVCPKINYRSELRVVGFEIIPLNIEKILSFNSSLIGPEKDFLNLYFKKETKRSFAIFEESQYLDTQFSKSLFELGFKSLDIYTSKSEISLEVAQPTLFTNQGKLKNSNLFVVFKNVEDKIENTSLNLLKLLLNTTFESFNSTLNCNNALKCNAIC